VALAAHDAGAELCLVDSGVSADGQNPDPTVVLATAEEIQSRGGEPLHFDSDMCDPAQIQEVFAHTVDHYGSLDGVVWSVGVRRDSMLAKADPPRVAELVSREIAAAFEFVRTAANTFGKGPGSIVMLAGTSAFFPGARRSLAAALDGAIIGLARSAASELIRRDIAVNVILPTARTRLTEKSPLFRSIGEDSMLVEQVAPMVIAALSAPPGTLCGEVLGIAGGRAYGFRTRETPGVFADSGTFSADEIGSQWDDLLRGA